MGNVLVVMVHEHLPQKAQEEVVKSLSVNTIDELNKVGLFHLIENGQIDIASYIPEYIPVMVKDMFERKNEHSKIVVWIPEAVANKYLFMLKRLESIEHLDILKYELEEEHRGEE